MQPFQQSITVIATTAGAVCASQTPLAAGPLLMNGSAVSGGFARFASAQFITITCAADDSARTFTINGATASGDKLSFTMRGAAIGVSTSIAMPMTVLSVVVDAATAGAVQVGVTSIGRLFPCAVDLYENPTTISVSAVVTGTINYTVQHSFNDDSTAPSAWTWFPIGDSAMVGATASQNSNYAYPPRWIAVLINSASNDATLTFRVIQAASTP